jgi:hypothetical protein
LGDLGNIFSNRVLNRSPNVGQFEHRIAHPIRVKVIDYSSSRKTSRCLPSDTDPNFSYGKPTRPSSPVANLMSDHYQREYEAQIRSEAEEHEKLMATKKKHPTKKDLINPLQKPKKKHLTIFERDPNSLFKMPRFTNMNSRVDCHRA